MSLTVVMQTCDQCKELRRPSVDLNFETAPNEWELHHFCSLICLEKWVVTRNILVGAAAGAVM